MKKNRTLEYREAVQSAVSRSGLLLAQPLFSAPSGPVPSDDPMERPTHQESDPSLTDTVKHTGKNDFFRTARNIGLDINQCLLRLGQLNQLAKRQTLFDDKPMEINQLINTIKHDISKTSKEISSLQAIAKLNNERQSTHKQLQEHAANVIASLQTKLALLSREFREILEVRTQNMREAKQRRDLYAGGTGAPTSGQAAAVDVAKVGASVAASALFDPRVGTNAALTNSVLFNPKRQANNKTSEVVLDLGAGSMGESSSAGTHEGNEQTMLLLRNSQQRDVSTNYYSTRATAIESIESTIAELGQVYQHFAQLLAGQREMIQRIDDNVQNTEMNVVGAHNELLRYYENMTSNRWFMIKVFAVIIFFFTVFLFIM